MNNEQFGKSQWIKLIEQAAIPHPIALNALWLILGRVGSQILAIAFTILVARSIGSAGLGQYAFMASLIFIGNIISTFGMDTLLIREVAARRSAGSFSLGSALWVQLIWSAFLISLVFFFAGRLPNQTISSVTALRIFSFSLLPLAFFTVFSAVLRAFERMDLYLVANLVTSASQTLGVFILFRFHFGLVGVAWALLSAQIIGSAAAAGLCVRGLPQIKITFISSFNALVNAFRMGFSFALLAIVAVIYQRFAIIALTFLTTNQAVGWYSAAGRVIEASRFAHYAILGALFPVLSNQNHWRVSLGQEITKERSKFVSRAVFVVLLLFSLGLVVCIQLVASPLIVLLFGTSYLPAILVLKVLVWSLVPYTLSAILSLDLVTRGREKTVLTASIMALVFSVPFYSLMIHTYGLVGAGLATVFIEVFQALLLILFSKIGLKPELSGNLSPAVIEKDAYGNTELSR